MTREEAINEVKKAMPTFWKETKEAIETLVPELSKSEDEKIRNEINNLYSEIDTCISELLKSRTDKDSKAEGNALFKMEGLMVATLQDLSCIENYLKKQNEQKPELPKPHKGDDCNPYDMGVSEAQEYAINRGFGIPFNNGEVYVNERYLTQTIGNILRWADEHPKEQKSVEWKPTEEQMKALESAELLYAHGLERRDRAFVLASLYDDLEKLI